jgi:hypothetical protein
MSKNVIDTISDSFSKLFFQEDKHIYTVNEKVLPSVSALVKSHCETFDELYWAEKEQQKGKESLQQILERWETKRNVAASNGTSVHVYAEKWWQNKNSIPQTNQQKAVKDFLENLTESGRYTLVSTELQMYSEKYKYAGTCDLLMWDNLNDTAVILDYKTNENLDKQYGFLLEPFSYSANTSFNKYQIQLSYYQLILEEIDIEVKERFIVWLKHDGTYEVRPCFDFTNVLKEYLNTNINESY